MSIIYQLKKKPTWRRESNFPKNGCGSKLKVIKVSAGEMTDKENNNNNKVTSKKIQGR